jgi:cobalamin synthase
MTRANRVRRLNGSGGLNGDASGYLRQRPRLLPYDLELRRARLARWRRRFWLWPVVGAIAGGLVGHVGRLFGWW